MNRQLSLLQDEVAQCKKAAEERRHAFDELQAQYDELNDAQAGDISQRRSSDDESSWNIVREELHRQADHLRNVEAENAKMTAELLILRQRHSSIEVLKEQKRELEKKLSGVEGMKDKVVRLEAELVAARQEREQWYPLFLILLKSCLYSLFRASKTSSSSPSHTPVSVTQNISSLRLANAKLLEENGSNVALLRVKEVELADVQETLGESQSEAERLEGEVIALKDKLRRAEQRAVLAE